MSDIFKAYDIRGKYPKEINKRTACLIGQAFNDFVREKTKKERPAVVIGRDLRKSSKILFKGILNGLMEKKAKIIDLGEIPTDALYFAFKHLKVEAGLMITASHNPLNWNGFKMLVKNHGFVFQGRGMEKLKSKIFEKRKFKKITSKATKKNIIPLYLNHIVKLAKNLGLLKDGSFLKIGVEFLGGVSSKIIKPLFKRLGFQTIYLNTPANPPDPLIFHQLRNLQKLIKKEKLDFGVAFDGDGDRCFFLDERGEVIDASLTLALFSQYLLKKYPQAKIAYNLVCSKVVEEEIKKAGGEPVKTPVGHVIIKQIAEKKKVIFGGEHSGHYFWKENNYQECSALVVLLMRQILSVKRQKLSDLIRPLKRYFKTKEIDLPLPKEPQKVFKKISSLFKKGRIDYSDGLTVEFPDWWFNLRESQTEPRFKLTLEAKSRKVLLEKKKKFLSIFSSWKSF